MQVKEITSSGTSATAQWKFSAQLVSNKSLLSSKLTHCAPQFVITGLTFYQDEVSKKKEQYSSLAATVHIDLFFESAPTHAQLFVLMIWCLFESIHSPGASTITNHNWHIGLADEWISGLCNQLFWWWDCMFSIQKLCNLTIARPVYNVLFSKKYL